MIIDVTVHPVGIYETYTDCALDFDQRISRIHGIPRINILNRF